MSENLELVKSIFAAWSSGDFTSADWADPEIELEMVGGLSSGKWTGLSEMTEAWAGLLRAWDHLRAIPEQYRELEDGRVLVYLRNEGRGKGSGIEIGRISARSANVFTVRDEKVTRLELYWDREDAISNLGLADETKPGTT